ncbi:hypothetical protein [Evansella halocellulosilytica]|uniref:hypothetical protein n=1 Tax=Evansella halocellulosilytica TaxID=2011013 RepID=UPI000BB81374|nr:hypothetical protein [Evansella halocellulosilytica]
MLFELFHDMIPLLFSMSIFLTIVGLKVAEYLKVSYFIKQRMLTKRSLQTVELAQPANSDAENCLHQRQAWLTCMTKRKDAPEDDDDYRSSAFIHFEKQGGQQWNNHLYSHSLNALAFSR